MALSSAGTAARFVIQMAFKKGEDYRWLNPTLEKIKEQALERARMNAPIDTGDFRKSIFVEYFVRDGNVIFDFGSTSPIPQTLMLHEAQYQLGEISASQPPTIEGSVGNKFFTRVIDYWAIAWADQIAEAIFSRLGEKQ